VWFDFTDIGFEPEDTDDAELSVSEVVSDSDTVSELVSVSGSDPESESESELEAELCCLDVFCLVVVGPRNFSSSGTSPILTTLNPILLFNTKRFSKINANELDF
jgi:hypothetical protein